MKLLISFGLMIALAGCASVPQANQAAASFSATATRICNVVQPTLLSVSSQALLLTPPLSASDQATLERINDAAKTFCSATATATPQTAQGLINQAFPALSTVIANSTALPSGTRNSLLLSLAGVQTAANILLVQSGANLAPVSQ